MPGQEAEESAFKLLSQNPPLGPVFYDHEDG